LGVRGTYGKEDSIHCERGPVANLLVVCPAERNDAGFAITKHKTQSSGFVCSVNGYTLTDAANVSTSGNKATALTINDNDATQIL
jgi:hypothetical protein